MAKHILGIGLIWSVLISCCMTYAQDMEIVGIPKGNGHVFWNFIRAGAAKAAEEIGNINLTWHGPIYNDDTPSQINMVNLYIHKQVDGILLVPTDKHALVEPVKKAAQAGIKVIVLDSGLDGHDHLSFIGTDNVQGGVLAAKYMASLLGKQGKVLILRTHQGSASTERRAQGFLQTIIQYPDIEIIADEYVGSSLGRASYLSSKLLGLYPDLNGIFAVNESVSAGMLTALRGANRTGNVAFIGFDACDELIEGLASHEVDGLIIQDPKEMGYLGMKAAVAAVRGEPFPPLVHTRVVLATPENHKQPDIQDLLYP